jgi:hypothetical protein
MSAQTQALSAFLPSGETGNKAKSVVLILVVVTIVILLIIFGTKIFKNIFGSMDALLEAIGLKDSPEKAAAKAAAADANNKANQTDSPFNPNFYRSVPQGTKLLTSAFASKLADQVYDSVGVIYDDPENGLSAIKQCSNWAQVSQLSDMFFQRHGKDLIGWLNIKYDTTDQKNILSEMVNYAFNLPKLS